MHHGGEFSEIWLVLPVAFGSQNCSKSWKSGLKFTAAKIGQTLLHEHHIFDFLHWSRNHTKPIGEGGVILTPSGAKILHLRGKITPSPIKNTTYTPHLKLGIVVFCEDNPKDVFDDKIWNCRPGIVVVWARNFFFGNSSALRVHFLLLMYFYILLQYRMLFCFFCHWESQSFDLTWLCMQWKVHYVKIWYFT